MQIDFRSSLAAYVIFSIIQFVVPAAIPLQTDTVITLDKTLPKDARLRVSCQLEEIGNSNHVATLSNDIAGLHTGRSFQVSGPGAVTLVENNSGNGINSVSSTVVNDGGNVVSSSSVVTNDGPGGGMTKSFTSSYNTGGRTPEVFSLRSDPAGDTFGDSINAAVNNAVADAITNGGGGSVTSANSVVVNNQPGGLASGSTTVVNNGEGNIGSSSFVVNPGPALPYVDAPAPVSAPLSVPEGVSSTTLTTGPETATVGATSENSAPASNYEEYSEPELTSRVNIHPLMVPAAMSSEIPDSTFSDNAISSPELSTVQNSVSVSNPAEIPASFGESVTPAQVEAQNPAVYSQSTVINDPMLIPGQIPPPQYSKISSMEMIPPSTPAETPTIGLPPVSGSINPFGINAAPNSEGVPAPSTKKITIPLTVTFSVPENLTGNKISPVFIPIIIGIPSEMFDGYQRGVADSNSAVLNNAPEENVASSESTAVNNGGEYLGANPGLSNTGIGSVTGVSGNGHADDLFKKLFPGGVGALSPGFKASVANSISAGVNSMPITKTSSVKSYFVNGKLVKQIKDGVDNSISPAIDSMPTRMANSVSSVVVNGPQLSGGNGIASSESVVINNGGGESVNVRSTVVN